MLHEVRLHVTAMPCMPSYQPSMECLDHAKAAFTTEAGVNFHKQCSCLRLMLCIQTNVEQWWCTDCDGLAG